jgi:hypothetical protein
MIGQVRFTSANLIQDFKGNADLILRLEKDSIYAAKQILNELPDGEYIAEVKKNKKKRTLDQNAYLWVLLSRIAERIRLPKEDVYRRFIRDVGVSDVLCVQSKASERFIKNWSEKGIGWFAESFDSKIPECINVTVYYGSSTYDTAEMGRLLDEVVAECKNLNIDTYVVGYGGHYE